MTEQPDGDDILKGLVVDWMNTVAAIAKHETIKAQLATQILERMPVGSRCQVGPGVAVQVRAAAMRFDAKLAQQVLTAEQYTAICEPKPSATLAAKMLPGALVELCKKAAGKPTLALSEKTPAP